MVVTPPFDYLQRALRTTVSHTRSVPPVLPDNPMLLGRKGRSLLDIWRSIDARGPLTGQQIADAIRNDMTYDEARQAQQGREG